MWILPRAFQITFVKSLLADRLIFVLFGTDSPKKTHSFDCCLVSGVLYWNLVTSTSMEWRENSFGLRLNVTMYSFEVVTRLGLWLIVSKRDTHVTDSFVVHKFYFKFETTEPCDMSVAPTIFRTSS